MTWWAILADVLQSFLVFQRLYVDLGVHDSFLILVVTPA